MAPESFHSQQIKHFRFWLDHNLRDGLRYQNALYERICSVQCDQRVQIYQQAKQLTKKGADVLITRDNKRCHLWLNLKHKTLLNSLPVEVIKDSPQNLVAITRPRGKKLRAQ